MIEPLDAGMPRHAQCQDAVQRRFQWDTPGIVHIAAGHARRDQPGLLIAVLDGGFVGHRRGGRLRDANNTAWLLSDFRGCFIAERAEICTTMATRVSLHNLNRASVLIYDAGCRDLGITDIKRHLNATLHRD